jgi:hypothetical protein
MSSEKFYFAAEIWVFYVKQDKTCQSLFAISDKHSSAQIYMRPLMLCDQT